LSRTGFANERERLTFLDLERGAVNDDVLAAALLESEGEIFDAEERGVAHW
jgi:hypothetical protein